LVFLTTPFCKATLLSWEERARLLSWEERARGVLWGELFAKGEGFLLWGNPNTPISRSPPTRTTPESLSKLVPGSPGKLLAFVRASILSLPDWNVNSTRKYTIDLINLIFRNHFKFEFEFMFEQVKRKVITVTFKISGKLP
jgi:hypothetical protein